MMDENKTLETGNVTAERTLFFCFFVFLFEKAHHKTSFLTLVMSAILFSNDVYVLRKKRWISSPSSLYILHGERVIWNDIML